MNKLDESTFRPLSKGAVQMHLSLEQQMLIQTLHRKNHSMTAFELTDHWMPCWSLQEVNKFLHDLVQAGLVQAHGRESKLYSIAIHESDTKASSK